jgi:hypothetical protein
MRGRDTDGNINSVLNLFSNVSFSYQKYPVTQTIFPRHRKKKKAIEGISGIRFVLTQPGNLEKGVSSGIFLITLELF